MMTHLYDLYIHLLLFRSLALLSTIAKISIPTYATISRYANTRGHSKLLSVTLPSSKLVLILISQKIQFSVQQRMQHHAGIMQRWIVSDPI